MAYSAKALRQRDILALFVRGNRLRVLAVMACVIASSLLGAVDPAVLRWLIDDVLPRGSRGEVLAAGTLLFAAHLARLLCTSISTLAALRLKHIFVLRLRVHTLRAYARTLPSGSTGDAMARILADIDNTAEFAVTVIPQSVSLAASGGFVLSMLINFHVGVVLTAGAINLLCIAVRQRYNARIARAAERLQASTGQMVGAVQDYLLLLPKLVALCRERSELFKTAAITVKRNTAERDLQKLTLAYSVLSGGAIAAGTSLALALVAIRSMQGLATAGAVVATYGYLAYLLAPVTAVLELQTRWLKTRASVERIRQAWRDARQANTAQFRCYTGRRVAKPVEQTQLEFVSVTAGYPNMLPCLRNASLRIWAGDFVAVSGPSGSGKTTLARLMSAGVPPLSGAVQLDGADVRSLPPRKVRRRILVLEHDPGLFARTLRENLLLGKPNATTCELAAAERLAHLDGVIQKLPAGRDCALGGAGVCLSAGERQRLGLARAILYAPKILVLDEATSAIDQDLERLILTGLRREYPGMTLIVISHREETLRLADRVLTIDDGQVIATMAPSMRRATAPQS